MSRTVHYVYFPFQKRTVTPRKALCGNAGMLMTQLMVIDDTLHSDRGYKEQGISTSWKIGGC